MSAHDDFEAEFNGELAALNGLFDERERERNHLKLGREDPDLRRILEAMAFFSARTRMLAQANVSEAVERLARGQLDDFLTSVPAMGLMQVRLTDAFSGPTVIPRGEELRITAPDRVTGVFTTLRKLAVLPLLVQSAEVRLGNRGGFQLVIRLDVPPTAVPLRGPAEAIPLFIDYLNDYRSSLGFLHQLRAHLQGVTAAFDHDDPDAALPCGHSFGAPRPEAPSLDDDGQSPLERIRWFFHFPAQELFFNVALPSRDTPWRRVYLYVDLDDTWSTKLRVNKEVFQLFVVPVANIRRGNAATISCDGTKDSYVIRDGRPPGHDGGPALETVLHSVGGVYQLTERGLEPVVPGVVADTGAVYDLERAGADPDSAVHRVRLSIPGAFEKPRKVVVDARWIQPAFDEHAAGTLKPSLQMRRIEGATLEIRGDLQPHRTSPLWSDGPGLLHVLSLKTKTFLTRDEVVRLMRLLGADDKSLYRGMTELLAAVSAYDAPERASNGEPVKRVYDITFQAHDDDLDGFVQSFGDQLEALLHAWIQDEVDVRRRDADAPSQVAPRRAPLRLVAGGLRG